MPAHVRGHDGANYEMEVGNVALSGAVGRPVLNHQAAVMWVIHPSILRGARVSRLLIAKASGGWIPTLARLRTRAATADAPVQVPSEPSGLSPSSFR